MEPQGEIASVILWTSDIYVTLPLDLIDVLEKKAQKRITDPRTRFDWIYIVTDELYGINDPVLLTHIVLVNT